MKKNFIYLCLIVIIVLIACSGKEDDKKETIQNKEEKTITIAEKAEIKTLDPQKTVDSASLSVIQMINQKLFKIDNDGNIIPEIAEEVTKVDTKTTLIKIKKDLFFSNGEPVTVDDVLFSLNRAKESPRMTQDFYMIESFEKVDDATIKVKTFYEAGNLLHKLASMGASIMNKKALEENENNIIGSGMFKLKEWVAGDRIVLERNEYFKEANSNIKAIIIKFIPEANSRMIMLETGEVDIAEALLPLDFQKISKEDDKFTTVEMQSSSNMFIGFDLRDKHLADKRVRQAIAYTINNQDIVDSIYNGSATVATSPIPKITTGHNENSNPYEQNIEKAKELLAEAGYPNGFDIVLNVNEDNQRVDTAVVIQDNLKAIGINVQIKTYQWASYVAFVENPSQEKGMFLMAWNIANDDPDELLYPLYHSSQIDTHTNVVFYKNEDFDSLISKARETIDKEKRIDLYKKAQDIIQEDLPHYAILYPMQNFAYKKNIKGIEVNKRGYFNFQNTIVE
ncbi:ABC transporter substrate-binding protein [Fusobacterium polymorphum]|uniref:DNA-binding protein n=1 Tax=Fusobacterium nucleatum subsp. polymorphum TaxID=76857 RepID=A0A2C6AZE0_FUSNP|nr:ABC transporter substrate-binding protein [Fusobacterium polymorphum]PHI17260.1 DNA-binding protein [Fusobacterium polymorphum]